MEKFILDYIVSNIMNDKKKTIKNQIVALQKTFGNAFDLEINEETIKERIILIKYYQVILKELINLPKVEQRSLEWHAIRKGLITASDFAQCLGKGKFGSANQFYKSKCGYEEKTFDMTIPALRWGVRYEESANMIYKMKLNVEVFEFGVLPHQSINFIGASPDGISDLGIMLEIKCPWKRKKTETIPEQYYYQIQGQLEVCNLDECDYLECYFKEYETYEEMEEDMLCLYKGVILENKDDTYLYGQINDLSYGQGTYDNYKNVYFYGMKDYFLKRVTRDKEFFKEIIVDLENVWKNVLHYRSSEEDYNSAIKSKERVKKKPTLRFRECEEDEYI